MNQSISQKEHNRRETDFLKRFHKWILKRNKNEPQPIYPPELQKNNTGDDYWEYEKGEELILDDKKRKGNRDEIIAKMVSAYKKRKLDRIKNGTLWKGFS